MSQLAINSSGVTIKLPQLTIPTNVTLSPQNLAMIALGWLVWIAGIIAFGFLIYGGILFVTSGGDAEKATKARNTILYAVVGVIVVTVSFALITWANGFVK